MERVFGDWKTEQWVVLEGIDGTGKSTIAKQAADRIEDLVVVEEPSGTPEGRSIAALIDKHDWVTEARIAFYGGLVRHSYDTTIYPLLTNKKRVLSVRSFPSTFAYQGGNIRPVDLIENMYADLLVLVPCPKIVLATCNEDTAIKRIEKRDGRTVGHEEADNLWRVNERYHDMAERFDWAILDTDGSIEATTKALVGMIT